MFTGSHKPTSLPRPSFKPTRVSRQFHRGGVCFPTLGMAEFRGNRPTMPEADFLREDTILPPAHLAVRWRRKIVAPTQQGNFRET